MNPGFVYDSGFVDWVRFLCGSAQLDPASGTCASFGSIDPSDLNQPNIAVGDLVGSKTITRTVTGVDTTDKYTVHVNAPAGIWVSVSPTSFKVKKGQHVTYHVTFTRTSAAANTFALGSLEWRSNKHVVHSQIAIRPLDIAAPAEASGTGDERLAERHRAARLHRDPDGGAGGSHPGDGRDRDPVEPDRDLQPGGSGRRRPYPEVHRRRPGRDQRRPVQHVRLGRAGRHGPRHLRLPGRHRQPRWR